MNGATVANGYRLINSPEALQALSASQNANAQTQYNNYRTGFGSTNLTSVLDPRRIEVALRFKF